MAEKKIKKGGLGKGLDAIFAENTSETEGTVELKINDIDPNRTQPRKDFDDEALQAIAESIQEHGVLQPILVRPLFMGGYQIIAGERRWRAARMAGLTTIPAVIRDMDDEAVMEAALIENLQREDLNPMEEAMGYNNLILNYGMTQEEVAKTIGKSRPAIANSLRLLSLPEEIIDMLTKGELSAGHGKALLAFKTPEEQLENAKKAVETGMSVRELEKLAGKKKKEPKEAKEKPLNHYYEEVRLALNEHLGRKVVLSGSKKKGEIRIEFYGEEDLKNLLSELKLDK
ncbi:MAG: ParB/RepB/Spo0J family partition protein [Clostridia bacterium]|nr:ParB/RepB/Spo0J family partition protein [Clostridia bacterium]